MPTSAAIKVLPFAALVVFCSLALAAPKAPRVVDGMPLVEIPPGVYKPQYPPARDIKRIAVAAFSLMSRPVTNAEFLSFVQSHETFRRDRISRLFADTHYLEHWAGPMELGSKVRPLQPVTRVSWFAAKAYCEAHGLRLPSEAEWELVAAASKKRRDGTADALFRKQVMAWYSSPSTELPDMPHGEPNYYGISDMHGVIWEWVADFNNAVVIADSREQGDETRNRFCGGAALSASDSLDYATFMRLAMRGSLKAHYTTGNLGFRCAAGGEP